MSRPSAGGTEGAPAEARQAQGHGRREAAQQCQLCDWRARAAERQPARHACALPTTCQAVPQYWLQQHVAVPCQLSAGEERQGLVASKGLQMHLMLHRSMTLKEGLQWTRGAVKLPATSRQLVTQACSQLAGGWPACSASTHLQVIVQLHCRVGGQVRPAEQAGRCVEESTAFVPAGQCVGL